MNTKDWAKAHPEHDRTSCSDSDPCNADPEGSTGCARCTALIMNHSEELDEETTRLFDFARTIRHFEGYEFQGDEPYFDINGNDLWLNTSDFSKIKGEAMVRFIFHSIEYVMKKAQEQDHG
jgi:hypothetical protein